MPGPMPKMCFPPGRSGDNRMCLKPKVHGGYSIMCGLGQGGTRHLVEYQGLLG